MDLSLTCFFRQSLADPVLAAAVFLTLAVIFVNGWTDAPNAVATVVGTKVLPMGRAIALAALCNLLGVVVMTGLNASVAMTMSGLVELGSGPEAVAALAAALFAVVVWTVAAWRFAIPTSESHALAAALTGAALGLRGDLASVNAAGWGRILLGLALSLALGVVLGYICSRVLRRFWHGRCARFFRRAQIAGAAAMAFMHGAQDGQKFLGVLLLALVLGSGGGSMTAAIPVWLMLLCAAVMAAGTAVGGGRIIRSVGCEMVRLVPAQGFAADAAGAVALLCTAVFGLPASTTHAKTAAILGAGAAGGRDAVALPIAGRMVFAWGVTFPACGTLGWIIVKILIS